MCCLFLHRCVLMLFEEMEVLYPSVLFKWPRFVLAKNLPKGKLLGICIGFTIDKTNIHVCVVGYFVPTCFEHFCKMLDMLFQHPSTVQCALFYAWLYAHFILLRNPSPHILLTNQLTYLFRISCVFIPKGVIIF